MTNNNSRRLSTIVTLIAALAVSSLVACNGDPGRQGVAGAKGAKGDKGNPGNDGTDGNNGTDGVDGTDGNDGTNGSSSGSGGSGGGTTSNSTVYHYNATFDATPNTLMDLAIQYQNGTPPNSGSLSVPATANATWQDVWFVRPLTQPLYTVHQYTNAQVELGYASDQFDDAFAFEGWTKVNPGSDTNVTIALQVSDGGMSFSHVAGGQALNGGSSSNESGNGQQSHSWTSKTSLPVVWGGSVSQAGSIDVYYPVLEAGIWEIQTFQIDEDVEIDTIDIDVVLDGLYEVNPQIVADLQ